MRSRILPARAFYRVVAGQSSSSSSSSSSASGGTGSSSSTTATTSTATPSPSRFAASRATPTARLSRSAALAARRRQYNDASATGSSLSSHGATSSTTSRRRRSSSSAVKRAIEEAPMIVVNQSMNPFWEQGPKHAPMEIPGIKPVSPPHTSLASVAMQGFYALQRPLLEHQVVSVSDSYSPTEASSKLASSAATSSSAADGQQKQQQPSESMKATLASLSEAIVQTLQDSGHISAEDVKNATVVIATEDELPLPSQHAQRVDGIEQERFSSLLDRLAAGGYSSVRREARKLERELTHQRDIETAVGNALERGENTEVAKALGSEAELVILGEPKGPDPKWARGVATHLAQMARAFEAPAVPEVGNKDASSAAKPSVKVVADREDDPNLLLSHAMVQATLPPALTWDRLVEKMDAAALGEHAKAPLNIRLLNAESLSSAVKEDEGGVAMDSTKRKRKKKMRKHKYRKLRKATRIERTRLKK